MSIFALAWKTCEATPIKPYQLAQNSLWIDRVNDMFPGDAFLGNRYKQPLDYSPGALS